jgi:hypothetical protein
MRCCNSQLHHSRKTQVEHRSEIFIRVPAPVSVQCVAHQPGENRLEPKSSGTDGSRLHQGEVGSPNVSWKTLQNCVVPFSIAAHTGMELTGKFLDDLLRFEPTQEGAWLEPMVIAVLQEVRCAAGGGIPWNSGSA